jgi:DNA-binding YbaB/EbfC family protein
MSKKPRRVPQGGSPRGRAGPDMEKVVQQALQMQAGLAESRARLAGETYRGTSGGGVVTAVVRGDGEVVSVAIDPAVLDPDDAGLVGDLVTAAVNQALGAAAEAAKESVGDLGSLSGLEGLSGLFG